MLSCVVYVVLYSPVEYGVLPPYKTIPYLPSYKLCVFNRRPLISGRYEVPLYSKLAPTGTSDSSEAEDTVQ